jgi:hypothetical protein
MLREIGMGMAAGACGTVALNVATYLDMAVRGRPSSDVPGKVAEKVATGVGISALSAPASSGADAAARQKEQASSRRSGAGALMGYVVGLGVGAGYGAVRPLLGKVPAPAAGLLLGAAAMASSDVPSVKLGVTDPRQWGTAGWLADLLPHLAYGLVAAAAYEVFTAGPLGRRSTPPRDRLRYGLRHAYQRL